MFIRVYLLYNVSHRNDVKRLGNGIKSQELLCSNDSYSFEIKLLKLCCGEFESNRHNFCPIKPNYEWVLGTIQVIISMLSYNFTSELVIAIIIVTIIHRSGKLRFDCTHLRVLGVNRGNKMGATGNWFMLYSCIVKYKGMICTCNTINYYM